MTLSEKTNEELTLQMKEIADEMKRREATIKENERLARLSYVKFVLEHRDVLLAFMSHSRGSCSTGYNNYYNANGSAQCNFCCLEDLNEWDDDIEVIVDVELRRVNG